jgi:hypothetical protein
LVVNQIREIANSPQTQKSFEQTLKKADSEYSSQRKIAIQKELEMLPIKRDRFTKAYGAGVMELNEYARNMKETTDIENNLRTELTELQEKERNNKIFREKVLHTIQVFRDFDKIWGGASFELKKDLLSSILDRVVYSKNKVKIEYKI